MRNFRQNPYLGHCSFTNPTSHPHPGLSEGAGVVIIFKFIQKNPYNMIIQINTDNNVTVHEAFGAELNERITEKLHRFVGQLTRVEIHLSDENGSKEGQKDKRCLMEARMEGMQPIVVTDMDDTLTQAVNGAIIKMKAALDSAVGKVRNH